VSRGSTQYNDLFRCTASAVRETALVWDFGCASRPYDLQRADFHPALYADDTCIHCTDRKEGYVLRNMQHGLTSMEPWCESWSIKINEDKFQAIYFSRSLIPVEACLTLNGRNIPFVNKAKYLSVIFYRMITRRLHIEIIEVTAFRTELQSTPCSKVRD
jgi:hypothetical protein